MKRFFCLFLIMFGFLGRCFAQTAAAAADSEMDIMNMYFGELPNVVTSTLKEQKITKAPSAINIVTAEEIKLKGYRTLKDAMLNVPGWIDVSDGNEEIISVRGAYASTTNKVLILLNGHRLNDLNLGRYNTDQFLGMDVVERIEFIKGSGSVLYGNGALIGIVNIITKKGFSLDGFYAKEKISIQNDAVDSETSLSWGKKINDLDVMTNFTYLNAEGDEVTYPARYDVVPSGATKAEGKVYLNKYPKNWSMFVSAAYQDFTFDLRREHYAHAVPRCPGNSSLYDYSAELTKPLYEADNTFLSATYKHAIDEVSSITINPSFNSYQLKELTWISTYGANRLGAYGSRAGQDSKYSQWQAKVNYDRELMDKLDWTIGFDVLVADFEDMNAVGNLSGSTYTGNAFSLTPMPNGGWTLAGGFTQFVWRPIEKLEITAGTRLDTFDYIADPEVTSRYGAVYSITDDFTAKLLYGQSLLSPQWAHVKRLTMGTFTPNSGLKPESFDGWDFILDYNKPKYSVSLNLFSNHIENLISSGTSTSYTNLGEMTYQGLELGAKYAIFKNLKIDGSYSLVRDNGNTTESGIIVKRSIKNIPQNIYRLGLVYTPLDKLDISLWGRTYSRTRTSDNVAAALTHLGSWTTVDFAVNYGWRNWDFRLGFNNLFDLDYEIGGANRPLPRPGMTSHFTVGKKF